jgi:hypothetical protein
MLKDSRRWLLALPVAAVVIGFGVMVWPEGRFLRIFGPSMATDLVGITIAVFVVEAILQRHRRIDVARHQAFAAEALRRSLSRLQSMLGAMCRTVEPGWAEPRSLEELLAAWVERVPRLDFAADAPVTPPRSWFAYATDAVTEIEDGILGNRDRNRDGFTTDTIETIEALLHDPVWLLLRRAALIPAALPAIDARPTPQLLVAREPAESFAAHVRGLAAVFEKLAGKPYPRG